MAEHVDLQLCFDVFVQYCNAQFLLEKQQVHQALLAIHARLHKDASPKPAAADSIANLAEADEIVATITGSPSATTLTFEQFYSTFSGFVVFDEIAEGHEIGPADLRIALHRKGVHDATTSELGQMLSYVHWMEPSNYCEAGKPPLRFHSFLHMYVQTQSLNPDQFLLGWYDSVHSATRNPALSPIGDFLAGTFAGIVLTLVGHPFDTTKVRLQTSETGRFKGGIDCAAQTFRKEGIRGLYKGMTGPMTTVPGINAVVFAAYGQAKSFLQGDDAIGELSLTNMTLAGMYAGLVTSIIVGPMELVKTQLQLQYTSEGAYTGSLDCVKQMLNHGGIRELGRGMGSTVVREVLGYAGQFASYELLKKALTPEGTSVYDLSAPRLMLAGGSAGIVAWIISYPADYVKSQLQAVPLGDTLSPSTASGISGLGLVLAWQGLSQPTPPDSWAMKLQPNF